MKRYRNRQDLDDFLCILRKRRYTCCVELLRVGHAHCLLGYTKGKDIAESSVMKVPVSASGLTPDTSSE